MILSNYCYDIKESIQGYLIISGDKGLSFLDPEQQLFKGGRTGPHFLFPDQQKDADCWSARMAKSLSEE